MKDSDSKVPDQKDLEKELNEYLGKKYGDRIRLVVPMLFPKAEAEEVSKEEKELLKTLLKSENVRPHEGDKSAHSDKSFFEKMKDIFS